MGSPTSNSAAHTCGEGQLQSSAQAQVWSAVLPMGSPVLVPWAALVAAGGGGVSPTRVSPSSPQPEIVLSR